MADQKPGLQGWLQTLTLAIPLALTVLAFFGIKNWSDWFGKPAAADKPQAALVSNQAATVEPTTLVGNASAAAPATPAVTASPPSPPAATPAITVTANEAVLSLRAPGRAIGSYVVVTTVTVRNGSDKTIGLYWDYNSTVTFDVDTGAHFEARAPFARFTGIPACNKRPPAYCDRSEATSLAPGEETLATVLMMNNIKNDEKPGLVQAKSGRFIGKLILMPVGTSDAETKSVSLPTVSVKSTIN